MSGSGFRGPGIEPRGICPNGLAGNFRGAHLSHPRFYHPRLPHGRLPTPDNWSGRTNHNVPFSIWTNIKCQRPMFRGKSHFRPNGRGRGTIHRGVQRFSNDNRPAIGLHPTDHNKNVKRPRTGLLQDQYDQDQLEQAKGESSLRQTPLLGSEEERQQKITQTVVRLKEKLSNITKEDITNLWQNDVSTISPSNVENRSTLDVGIPTLSHEKSELNLTLKDFKDISRIDSSNFKSDKSNDTDVVVEHVSNFIQDTVKEVESSPIIEVIDLVDMEEDIVHGVESMTVVNDMAAKMSQNNNGQKLQEGTNSLHSISLISSTVSETCDSKLVYSLQQNATKINLLKDQHPPPTENTQTQDHRLNTKCASKSSHQLGYQNSDDNCNLANIQKSCDDAQHEQVNTIIEMQYSLHRSVSKITKERTHWTPLPYETSSCRRKPFKSRWLHNHEHDKSRNTYTQNKSKNELTAFDLHASSPYLHRDMSSLGQDSQYNTSFNLNGYLPSGEFSTMQKLINNQDNSQSMLCLNHNTSSSISTIVSSNQEHTLQRVPAFDSWKSSPAAICYNTSKEKVTNIPNFNPQQPPPNFKNQKGTVPLSPVFDSHFLSQKQSNLNTHALDSSQQSAVSTSPTDLYCPVTFSTTQGTKTFSTISQLSITSSPSFLSNVPTNFSPILTYATPLQMTSYEVPSSATLNNIEDHTLLCDKILDQVPNQHNIVEVKDELEEMKEAMQFAKQAMNITDMSNIIEFDQTCSEAHLRNMSLEQEAIFENERSENVSDVSHPVELHHTANKEKEKLSKHCNKKDQVITDSYVSSELNREKHLNQNYNIDENTLLINEQGQTNMVFNLNSKLNKINEQGKGYQQNINGERNMHIKEWSSEKKRAECASPESSWKNRIINRFLKMSKNEIRNMINNCSLRKFDIAMKHLVKKKRSSLSLEMRNAENAKITSYNREEFMNQLNAMLDPAAIVDITNLPTEFIRHLSEVLQLDAIPFESSESVDTQSNNGSQHNNSDVINAVCENEQEILNNSVIPNSINVEKVNEQTNIENSNQLENYCNRITPSTIAESSNNDNNLSDSNQISPKIQHETNDVHIDHITNITQKNIEKGEHQSLFDMTDLDDIFSTVTTRVKGESKSIILDDKPKSTSQVNTTCELTKTLIPIETASITSIISKNKLSDPTKQHEYSSGNEYISKSERYNRWTRREREGPDAFRNLTKEEWEAKYGRHTKSSSNSCEMQTSRYYNNKHKNTKHSIAVISKRHPSPHSFKRNRNYTTNISNKVPKKDKNTETVSSTSNSSDSETDDTSTSSDNRTPSDVTKLLKVIKEKEKIAKKKSLNETIRDEVTAEIQRKWNEEGRKRRNHKKDKRRKEKRARYKERRKKRRKMLSSSCNSDYGKDDRSSLLTETEIKKESTSKEESDSVLEKSIKCDIKTTNVLTDKKVSLELKDKSTVPDNDRSMLNSTIIQPKTKAQLKLIPETSKCIQETEFMKNTAKIVLNVKCKENKITTLNNKDKSKVVQKMHQTDKDSSGINETSECPNKRLVDVTETAHSIFNNNDSTNKNFISASIIEKQNCKEKTNNLAKEVSSVTIESQESSTKGCMDNKVTSKKIDIKAYKERALQRKIENEEKRKEKNPTLSSNNISKSVIEEKDTSNVDLKEKHAAIQTNKISTDFHKFKNIRSEGKKELQLKKEKMKKKTEKEIKIKETKEISSVNQENVNDISDATELLKNEITDDRLDARHINQDECVSLIQKLPIQSKEMPVNDIPSKNTLKETADERHVGAVSNTNSTELVTVIMGKEKSMRELQIADTSTQASEVLNDLQTVALDKDEIEPSGKCDENKIEYRTKTISTCGELLAKHELCDFTTNINELSLQNNKTEKHKIDGNLSDCVNFSTDLKLNLMQDVSQVNIDMLDSSTNISNIKVVTSNEQDINLKENITITNIVDQNLLENRDNINVIFSNEENINLKENITITNETDQRLLENLDNINIVSPSEQNLNLEVNIAVTNKTDQKLLESLDNLEIQKVNSPESVGSPFKGFVSDSVTCSSCQHVEINNVITINKDNFEEDKNKKLQSYINDKFNWKTLSNQETSADNNNTSFRNGFNDPLDTIEQTYAGKEEVLHENVSEINENMAANLNNNANLLDSDNDKDKTKKKTVQMFVDDCTNNYQNDEKDTDEIIQCEYSRRNEKSIQSMNVETNIPHTSSEEYKMPMENEYKDNTVMKKSNTNVLKDFCFKEKQSSTKNINSICVPTAISLIDINSTIASSCSEISNETLKNVIDTDTESSLSSLLEGNITENNSTFKDVPNQNIINSNNIDSCEEENTNNNDSYLNNISCANFSINLPVSTESFWKSSTQDTSKKLKIPTKAALKESRNIFTVTDDSFSSVKETMGLKDSHFKLNLCNDQKAVDMLTDQISQKENIANKMINLEQKKCSHNVHTYTPDDKESCKSIDTDSLSRTFLNNVRTIHDEISTSSNHNSYIKESESTHTLENPIVEFEKIKETNQWIKNTIHQSTIERNQIDENVENLSCKKTNKQEKMNNLHRIKTKQAMKHKMKNKCKSNTVHVTNTNIKEEIMARMIEIDMEIHKLMTEKMTLYQMLENDSLLSNKLPLNSNSGSEISNDKIVSLKSQTSSSAISRIMQIAGTSFGENSDCIVTPISENISCEISENQTELKVEDTDTDKHKCLLQEENLNCKQIAQSHSPEDRTISEDSESAKSLVIFNEEDKIQKDGTVLSQEELKENQDSCNSIEETLNNFTESNSSASMPYFEKEEQLCVSSPTDTEPSNENQNVKSTSDGEKKQNKESVKLSKGKNSIHTSLIYSDDSTWGSFIPSLEDMEQKKHNTGLALLEETYKREMAENRKLKANARKKKKKELDTFLKSVNYLTPEEEEIPLNALYIKKLQQKRDLLDSLDENKESSVIDNSTDLVESEEMWKHAMEVINAVAENRVKDLYIGKAKESESEMLIMPSNTIKKNADVSKAKMLTNLREPLQSLNETQNTVSSLSCNQEPNSFKCSLKIKEEDVLQLKERKEDNENKRSNVQSTVNSYNNLEVNPLMIDTSSDDKVTQDKISLGEQLLNADYITDTSVPTAVNDLNIADTKLNKNRNNHTFQTSSSNEETIVDISTSENLKYNNKTEETNMQSTCLLKNKETIASKGGYDVDETISNTIEGTLNMKNNSLKKCKDHMPKTIDSSGITESNDISRSSNIHDKKTFKRKNNNKNVPMRKNSRYIEDNMKHVEHDDTNSDRAKDTPNVLLHDSKSVSWADQELESASSNVKRNRCSQKLQSIKDKKYINCLENEASNNDRSSVGNKNLIERDLPNVDSQVSTTKVQGVAIKRKVHDQSEMMNCKVILVDVLKSNMYHHIVKKFHTNSTKIHMPYKSITVEVTTNSTHSVTSSLITDTCKVENIQKSKHSCTPNNMVEETSNTNQKYIKKICGTSDNTRELNSRHKVNAPHSDESLSLESNSKDIPVISTKSINLNVKVVPQEDKKPEIEILETRTKDQYIVNQHHNDQINSPNAITENEQPLRTQYTVHKGPILDIKVFGDTFLAASEDGSIYRYSQISNGILNIYKGHRSAVTCLYIHKSSSTDYLKDLVYSGSLDGTLRCYNIKTGASINNAANVGSPVQCMDQAWGIIFIGTKSGHVSRFHIKCGVIKGDSIQFSNQSVLALKATNEGPRKVLIVATRNQPITIRDAQNGLFLRTICGQRNHTVYSLMLNNSLIYCGTSSTSILVFDFTNGEQKVQYAAGVGIVCMRLYHKLLFAGCYDGNIYVFDIEDHRLICNIPGPGNMLLSMEVVDNKIIAGSKDKRLHTWQMPKEVQVVSREIT